MPTKKTSALQAARLILEQAGTPLHYEEITKRILAQGLWHTTGKTPDESVNSRLAVDIKSKGTASLFTRPSPGHYALNSKRAGANATVPQLLTPNSSLLTRAATLSFTDAAERILDASASKQLHYRDITRLALDQHLLDTTGKTPEATLYAQILTEVKRRRLRRDPQRFMLLGKGMVSLAKWQASGIAYQVNEANK